MKVMTHGVWVLTLLAVGCSTYRTTGGEGLQRLEQDANASVDVFKRTDPGMQKFFEKSHGYAVFPEVIKGAAAIGVAHGEGAVFEQGQVVGTASVTQGTVGVQVGAQGYREIIFFEHKAALDMFKLGNLEFEAQAAAVLVKEGAGANADFQSGVAVFVLPKAGLMFDMSIGGQKFRYYPKTQPSLPTGN